MSPHIRRDYAKDDPLHQAVRRQTRMHRLIASVMFAALLVFLLMFMFSERRPPEAPKPLASKEIAAPNPAAIPGIRRMEPGEAWEPVAPMLEASTSTLVSTTTSTSSTSSTKPKASTSTLAVKTPAPRPTTTLAKPPVPTEASTPRFLQLGVFSSRANAEQLMAKIGVLEGMKIIVTDKGYAVQAGPFDNLTQARKARDLVQQKARIQAHIKTEVTAPAVAPSSNPELP